MLRRATPEERKIYYLEEWKPEDLPTFITDSLEMREFGFDYDGSGPRDRYNRFTSVADLEVFLRERAPFSVYNSISYYNEPEKRKGWIKAELVFDIDAKEMAIKTCCLEGQVCEECLENAKKISMEITGILRKNLGLKNIFHVYSGRGYHIRVFDDDLMEQGSEVRAEIFEYVRDRVYTPPELIINPPSIISNMMRETIEKLISSGTRNLENIPGIGFKKSRELYERKDEILDDLDSNKITILKEVLGEKLTESFLNYLYKAQIAILDAKVTVDIKRILRLPSSLHSTVSMKCMLIKDLKSFSPFRDAVPRFMKEKS